jgi:hypothetical protein
LLYNPHLSTLRHVLEKKRYPALGILSLREAIRLNQQVHALYGRATGPLAAGCVTTYPLVARPSFVTHGAVVDRLKPHV